MKLGLIGVGWRDRFRESEGVCVCVCVRERKREREREREIEKDRQKKTETDKNTEKEIQTTHNKSKQLTADPTSLAILLSPLHIACNGARAGEKLSRMDLGPMDTPLEPTI